jgi:hypothetical protein
MSNPEVIRTPPSGKFTCLGESAGKKASVPYKTVAPDAFRLAHAIDVDELQITIVTPLLELLIIE